MSSIKKYMKQHQLPIITGLFVAVLTAFFFISKPAKASDDDHLGMSPPLDSPMTTEMVYVGSDQGEKEVVIIDKETGDAEGFGVIRWVKSTGKAISEKSTNLYDKWTDDEVDLMEETPEEKPDPTYSVE